MTFNSTEFLLYFPIVLILYFLLPKKFTWVWLLGVSYWFYMTWNSRLIFLILFTTAVSYGGGLIIEKSDSKKVRRSTLAATIIICLGVLFFFKYFNFLTDSINAVISGIGGGRPLPYLSLILPVGISFYTFQTLSYAIDIYRGTIKAERHFGYYALYVSFFPQLVAGPIERPENLLPQLKGKHPIDVDNVSTGLKKMVLGYFKKVVVADMLAVYADKVFNAPQSATGFSVLFACLAFTVQIYCDFSGYTDIAIGCARIMGIKLMQNFDLPYGALSIKEFWAKWHISLSSWFKDYLYIPLGGNRCSKARHMINLMIVFLVSGLWHGASWHFVLWGGLHGLYQVVGMLTKDKRDGFYAKLHIDKNSKTRRVIRHITTFFLVSFAWLLFRANTTSDMFSLIPKLFADWSSASIKAGYTSLGLNGTSLLLCVFAVLIMALMDRAEHKDYASGAKATGKAKAVMPYAIAVWAVILGWIILQATGGSGTFIYFQF